MFSFIGVKEKLKVIVMVHYVPKNGFSLGLNGWFSVFDFLLCFNSIISVIGRSPRSYFRTVEMYFVYNPDLSL